MTQREIVTKMVPVNRKTSQMMQGKERYSAKEFFSTKPFKFRSVIAPTVDCPLSKGNQAPHPKFERPNEKIL